MNNQLTKSALSLAIALAVVACGPGGSSGVAGIGGSGYISSGSVTGFGSVFVNGVEFETDSATFDIEGDPGTQDDLAIGMVVKVDGSINDDGITGTATSISFDDELQGPVSTIVPIGNDGVKSTITVLGVNVIIDSSSTTFDSEAAVFDFNTIAINNNVEVSGFFDSKGDIQATRLELKDVVFDANSIVEIKGTITGTSGTTFSLGGLTVDASSATLDDLPDGLVNGQLVEVKGTFDIATDTITATKVEAEDDSVEDTEDFEIEGLVTDYIDDSNFKIAGISVDASTATRQPATLSLENDIRIEVEGAIVDGKLIATEIELEGGSVKVHANVTDVNVAANTFELTPVSTQPPLTVTVTTGTQLEDDVNEIEPFTLNNLVVGNFVEVQGFDDGAGGIMATEVEVKEADEVKVQGYATDASGTSALGTMTVFGIIFNFDGTTDFEDENEDDMDAAQIDALISAISIAPQLVEIESDGSPVGMADEIEIESP